MVTMGEFNGSLKRGTMATMRQIISSHYQLNNDVNGSHRFGLRG